MIPFPNNILQLEFTPPHQYLEQARHKFLNSELGKYHQAIPWDNITGALKKKSRETRGQKAFFTDRGKLALLLLKSRLNITDKELFARISSDYFLQFFCDVYLRPTDKMPDCSLMSKIRGEIADRIDYDAFQETLATHWTPFMEHPEEMLTDATCYESHMRYPTDVKLLWESCEALKSHINKVCKNHGMKLPRSQYGVQAVKQLTFAKRKRKTYKQVQARRKSLLTLLKHLISHSKKLLTVIPSEELIKAIRYVELLKVVEKVYQQQYDFYQTNEYPKDRIVSLDKDYIRPIVRGKEGKRVEFGAKVNVIQVAGVNFVEHFSYDAFHEGNRLIASIELHKRLTGVDCERLGADLIYATNDNRKHCTMAKIQTSFIPKGRLAKDEGERKEVRKELARKRATMMEGSFGVEKQFYGLSRMRARNARTEKLWIIFGIHTANAMRMIPKMEKYQFQKQAA